MNKFFFTGIIGASIIAGLPALAAEVPVTGQPEWTLSGRLRGAASLTCEDPSPAPEEPPSQAIPTPIGTPQWVSKIQFAPQGTFKYWEIDANLKAQPLAKWANYNGTWTQNGGNVRLSLDAKSEAALLATYSGGSKCGANNPCFDRQRYRFTGTATTAADGRPRLDLKQTSLFGVHSVRAAGQYRCSGQWRYTKSLRGD